MDAVQRRRLEVLQRHLDGSEAAVRAWRDASVVQQTRSGDAPRGGGCRLPALPRLR